MNSHLHECRIVPQCQTGTFAELLLTIFAILSSFRQVLLFESWSLCLWKKQTAIEEFQCLLASPGSRETRKVLKYEQSTPPSSQRYLQTYHGKVTFYSPRIWKVTGLNDRKPKILTDQAVQEGTLHSFLLRSKSRICSTSGQTSFGFTYAT